jgi:tetratricopeptide (TPR) repeat protein
LLDACALEAKLLGAGVLRAGAADAEPGDFGLLRVLVAQLVELMPGEVDDASRLSRPVLASVLGDLLGERRAAPAAPEPDRSLILRELRELVLALARKQRLLIAVDDFDRCDEASMAVLAALAAKTERHPLVVALVVERGSASAISPIQRLLRSVCDSIAVDDLNAVQTEALLRSVFGDVANLSLIGGRIHALAHGNPRTTMELAQHLVDKGLIRHEAGTFSLPDALDDHEMPHTLASSLRQRLAALSSDARQLCQVLHVTEGDAFGLADYANLTPHRDQTRVFAALDELVAARVLMVEGDRYRFSQRGFAAVIADSLPAADAALLHGRVACVLADSGGDVLRRAHHLLASGSDELQAVESLAALDLIAMHAPLPLLKRAVACADRLAHPARHALRMGLLAKAQAIPDIQCFQAHVGPLIAQLERDSGLVHYRELAHLPEPERLDAALSAANEAYLATPERERGVSVKDAIQQLGQMSAMFNSVSTWTLDLATWDQMPSLEPFEPLSPSIGVVNRFADASKAFVQGRFLKSGGMHQQVLERVSQADRAGLEGSVQAGIQLGLHLVIGLRTAGLGLAVAEEHARELDKDRKLRVSAWRIRQMLHMARGDAEESRRCMRQAELLQLQIGGEQHAVGSTFAAELPLAAMMGDTAALKTAVERMASIAEQLPGWRPLVVFGQSRLRLLQGDAAGALELLLPAFELAPPGRHWCYILLCEGHLAALNALGRFDEAITTAYHDLKLLEREELSLIIWGSHLMLHWALALSKAGRHEQACRRAQTVVNNIEQVGTIGFVPGLAYETRARVALAASDFATFDRYAELCAREYCRFKHPVLAARLARLSAEARAAAGDAIRSTLVLDELSSEASHSEHQTVVSRMRECHDAGDRARCALTILLQHLEIFAGYLYGVSEDGATLLAGLPDATPDTELDAWVQSWTAAELAALEREPVTHKGGRSNPPPRVASQHIDRDGRRFVSSLLSGRLRGDDYAAAVLVMQGTGRPPGYDRALAARLAGELLEHGDVSGVMLDLPTETRSD